MPWKLLLFILAVVLSTVFIGFNLGNACNISVVFYEFKDVPVFITILIAFAIGVLVMIPFTFGKKPKQEPKTTLPMVKKETVPPVQPDISDTAPTGNK